MAAHRGNLKQLSRKLTEGLTLEPTVILIASTLISAFLLHHPAGLPLYRWLGYNILMLLVLPLLVISPIHPQRKRQSSLWWTIWTFTLAVAAVSAAFVLRLRKPSPTPSAVLVGLAAFLLVVLIYLGSKAKLRLSDYGVCLGQFKKWGKVSGILFALMVPVLLFASRLESFQKVYPLFRLTEKSFGGFLTVQGCFGGYWFVWEFFFRGFMLFGLARRYGAPTAIFIQAIPFTLLHFGKPELEVYASFIAAIVLGYLDWWGESILPSFLLHWMVALSMDLLAILT